MEQKMPITEDENTSTGTGDKERNSPLPAAVGASKSTASQEHSEPREHQLMEEVLSKENMTEAMKRVVANKGAAGVDDMTVDELKSYLKQEWPRIRGELLEGRYKPKPVRRVMIPKAGGGERALASAMNGRGPWWNAGASHMNQAYPITYFNKLGLVALQTKLTNS
jgi:retron-type reverse transcriptase